MYVVDFDSSTVTEMTELREMVQLLLVMDTGQSLDSQLLTPLEVCMCQ
jgi:hypothetical protein